MSSPQRPADTLPPRGGVFALLAAAGSLRLAALVMTVLSLVMAWATFLEVQYGSSAASFGVYGAWWFTALGILMAVNITAAMLARLPWKRGQTPFVIAHVGILLLLIGCYLTRRQGVEAVLAVPQNQSASVAYDDRLGFDLTVLSGQANAETTPEEESVPRIPFSPGPFNWEDYQRLSWFPWHLAIRDRGLLYDRDGVRLEVLDYYSDSEQLPVPQIELRTASARSESADRDDAAAKFTLSVHAGRGPHGGGRQYGMGSRHTLPGGQRIVFWMTGSAAETAAFLQSKPAGPLGKQGRVVLYAEGQRAEFALDDWKPGERRPLGSAAAEGKTAGGTVPLEVELVGIDPAFTGVRLLVHAGKSPPQAMFLFADFPEFSEQDYRDEVFGSYWYDGPRATEDRPGVEKTPEEKKSEADARQAAARYRVDILQGADQLLYCRTWQAPEITAAQPLPVDGASVDVLGDGAAGLRLTVEKFLPSPKPDVTFAPLPFSKQKSGGQQRQAKVRLTVDDTSEEFWLAGVLEDRRDMPMAPRKTLTGRDRRVTIALRTNEVRLGTPVFLKKFERKLDPGSNSESHYSSLVDFLDGEDSQTRLKSDVLITMNKPIDVADPLSGRSYRLFQSGFAPQRRPTLTYLTVNYDPGRGLKYVGCLLIVLGIFIRYFGRARGVKA